MLSRRGRPGRPHLLLGWGGSVNRGGSQAPSPPSPRDTEPGAGECGVGGGGGMRLPRARTGLTLLNPIQTSLVQGFRVGSSVSPGSIL